jgi:hypothetical protein
MANQEVKVLKFNNIGDSKGPVINLDFTGKNIVEIPVFYREAESNPEGHFHRGTDASFDPQYVYVLKGKMEFTCIYTDGRRELFVVEELQGIVLPKLVYHRYKTSEYTIFCEPRLEKYDINNNDKIICSAEDYPKLISEILKNEE